MSKITFKYMYHLYFYDFYHLSSSYMDCGFSSLFYFIFIFYYPPFFGIKFKKKLFQYGSRNCPVNQG